LLFSTKKCIARRSPGEDTHHDERPKGGGDVGEPQILSAAFLINTHLGAQMKLRHKVPITARLGVIGFAPKVDLGPKVNYFDPPPQGLTSHVDDVIKWINSGLTYPFLNYQCCDNLQSAHLTKIV